MDKNDVEESIFKELTEILYNNLKLGLIAIFLHATILLIFLLGVVDTRYLVWWYLIISLNLVVSNNQSEFNWWDFCNVMVPIH